jgi:hypothetical protein
VPKQFSEKKKKKKVKKKKKKKLTSHQMASIVSNLDALKAAGASRVLVTSVNDPFVLAAFAKPYATHAPFLQFLADSDAEFAIAINAAIDLSVAGLGLRSNRYALVVNKGVIEHQLVEEKPAQLVVTDAKNVVPLLSQSLQATYEAKVAQALAAGLFPQVVFNANRMVVKGLRITPAIYAALVQAAAAVGRPNSARHFLAHWQNDASAKFSANDAANAEKWIAGASKKILYPDDPAIIAELEALAAKVPRLKLA